MFHPDCELLRTGLGDPAAAFVDLNPPNVDKSSAMVFEKSMCSLTHCLNKHKRCNSAAATQNPLLPTRVIDVGGNDPALVAKIHISTADERGAYCCLSYCWGEANQYLTTRQNLESTTKEIPKSQLAKTILDAMEATQRLGFRFLWVDALCIIQDSDEDKSTEINKMGAIFRNATLTIAAATARSATEGFLRTPRKELKSCAVRLRFACPTTKSALSSFH
ncbi:hypothetical protein CLAIMM_12198 isoform 3 [Cladophialophora immunda]|nr:hypothetical protein CLAIMM_12198 isoform 3 [Cladophialophora immunda]